MRRPSLLLIGGLVALAAFVAFSALFTVHQTQQALILQFGNPIRVEREPGLKAKVPFLQNVEFFEKRILDLDPPVQEVLLSDQKRINVDAFARYRIADPLEFKKRAVTINNFQQIFGARMNSIIRTEVARVSLADMLSQNRAVIMGKIAEQLRQQGSDFGVEVIDVRLGRTDLPDATSQAVYNRMRSARVAQAAQLRAQGEQLKATIQAEADRERTVIIAEATRQSQTLRGEGDALRTRTLNDAYGQDPEFFDFFRSLEAYSALGGEGRTLVLTPDSDFFRFFRQEGGGPPSGEAK
ncbi:MAG: protease modulator HflC [Rhodospirillales bacterium]|jgi:membrane protease subunit HflC|nr:protease modulator HflC [Rhodospirillales bacterium]